MDAVNDRAIKNAGTPDSAWLPWLARQPLRRVLMNTICPDDCRLVVVAPHPDDEVLACGGLLAMRARRALPSLVVAVTDGEASHGRSHAQACADLGAQRAGESYAGLEVLDVPSASVVRLGIADGGAAWRVAEIARKLAGLVKPNDVLLTTWCLDGHPDHEAVNAAVTQVCSAVGCRLIQAPVWMWHWAEPNDARVPWNNLVALELPNHAMQAKQDALQCHRSQLDHRGGGMGPVLMPSIVARAARAHEYFFI